MKDVLRKIFEEAQGEISMVRIMALLSLLTGIAIGLYGVYKGKDLSGVAQICAVFVSAAFIGKVTQKFAERE